MNHRRPTIHTTADANQMHAQIPDGATRTIAWLRSVEGEPMAILKKLRYETVGHDPLTGQPLNLVEQLNQTFTILVSLRAVEKLIELYPEVGGFCLALGTCSGRDIVSVVPENCSMNLTNCSGKELRRCRAPSPIQSRRPSERRNRIQRGPQR